MADTDKDATKSAAYRVLARKYRPQTFAELIGQEPMVRTLEVLERLMPGEALAALLPREPLFLFKELEARGYRWRGGFEPDGSYRIVICAGRSREGAS